MQGYSVKKQNGTTMFLLLVFIVGLFIAVGMATDSGHWLLNKTRLQNAMDAAALSAAIALNYDVDRNTANATEKGKDTFDYFKGANGNEELLGVSRDDLIFEYSRNLNPFDPTSSPAAFVRVSTDALAVKPIYIQILSAFRDPVEVYSISTAGLTGQNCKLVPLVICPMKDEYGEPIIGCDESGCNGIPYDTRVCLKGGTEAARSGTCQDASLPNGNFGLLRFEGMSGKDDIRELLAGSVDICVNSATWENGNAVGPVSQGIGTRFETDKVTAEFIPGVGGIDDQTAGNPTNLYKDYYDPIYSNDGPWDNADGTARFRVVQVPLAEDCDSETLVWNGRAACFFMNQEAVQTGTGNEIYGELTGSCPAEGNANPVNPVFYGPTKVVLYKTDGSNDS